MTGENSLRLPLDGYYLSPGQWIDLGNAVRAAELACIHRYLPGVNLEGYGYGSFIFPSSLPLDYLTVAQAARYGYRDPQAVQIMAQRNAADAHSPKGAVLSQVTKVDNGTVKTFAGKPVQKGGCTAAGMQAVTHGVTPSLRQMGNSDVHTINGVVSLINQDLSQQDPRVKSVSSKWSACMRAKGYDYTSPVTAELDHRWGMFRYGPFIHSLTKTEVEVAIADAECRSRVNLYAVYWAVAAAYQGEWLADPQNLALAQAQQRADNVMLSRVRAILGG